MSPRRTVSRLSKSIYPYIGPAGLTFLKRYNPLSEINEWLVWIHGIVLESDPLLTGRYPYFRDLSLCFDLLA